MDPTSFDKSRICFGKPVKFTKVAGAHIVNIRYEDKTSKAKMPISFHTPILFSFGARASTFQDSENNWSMSLTCYDVTKGATSQETAFIKALEGIESRVKRYLKDPAVKKATGKWYPDPLIDMLTVFYKKMEDGVPVADRAPVLYPKLLKSKTNPGEVATGFYKIVRGKEVKIPPIKDKCRVLCDLAIDSIFLGAKPSIQLKLIDVFMVEHIGERKKTLVLEKLSSSVREEIAKFSEQAEADAEDTEEDASDEEADDEHVEF
ncbi:p31K protein [Largemouth bass virus]|uniref:P31K protein n=1 Tax=Largemouth bass virus TaxID=176656 RepID=A0A9E7PPB1_9VIRU|nr:putative p31K protein [Mandarin fish ranavirus]UUY86201.1 p31K protein [Largemouth bass virus]WEI29037.1 p31K protein [Largemouth bass virus]WHA35500.1 putative p31K protein [Micropterus salmoides ranavirus]WHA35605.1 putative p31K protein [Siniperca chuatsi ranavirus]